MNYARKVATALDQMINAILAGWPDESLSARCWRWHRDGKRHWPRRIVNALFAWQVDHCHAAYKNEWDRRQLPPEYRETPKP